MGDRATLCTYRHFICCFVNERKRYTISFFDTMFAHAPEDIIPSLEKHHPDFLVLYDDGFNYLTKMCLTNMREAAFKMIKLAKEKGCTVIVSSSDSTDHYEQYLKEGADFILTWRSRTNTF